MQHSSLVSTLRIGKVDKWVQGYPNPFSTIIHLKKMINYLFVIIVWLCRFSSGRFCGLKGTESAEGFCETSNNSRRSN